jgi:hypothetical protein
VPVPIHDDSQGIDLSKRIQVYSTVDASPALAAETVIATLTIVGFADTPIISGAFLFGWAAYTVGTSGTAVRFRIRQTGVAGTVKADTGALTGSQHGAGILSADDVNGFDTAPVGVYVLTMQVTAGAAASTVSALVLGVILI